MMKYGVIVYHDTKNIGDDIQSYAAAQLLPHVDYFVEREQLDVFRPKEEQPVNVIMNGWLMYNKLAWPVSPCINPLYISMHFWQHDPLGVESSFLDEFGKEDLCQHEPIGCRDVETQKMLEKKGIRTWFSGCLTLTLKPKYPKTEAAGIYLVNVSDEVEQRVRVQYPTESIHVIDQEAEGIIDYQADWEKRFENVEKLLTQYQNAKAVVTTRLHCALPCLALGTPVLLLSHDSIAEQGRFAGLDQFVRHATERDFLAGVVEFDLSAPSPNSDDFLSYRSRIEEHVKRFIENNQKCTPELLLRFARYDGEWEKRTAWKNEQLYRLSILAISKWKKDHEWLEELTAANEWNKNKCVELEWRLAEKEKIIQEFTTQRKGLKRVSAARIISRLRRFLECMIRN